MIEIRRARLADVATIRRLSLESVADGIPEGRDITPEQVVASASEHLVDLEVLLQKRREVAILVACDEKVTVGFLILEFGHVEDSTGESQSFIHNMAVQTAYRGRYVTHKLVYEASRLSFERGFRYMTSKVTASNERALITAVKMGFEIERYQLTMACGPEGPVKMPGRPMHQRGQAVQTMLSLRKRNRSQSASNPQSGDSQ